MCNLKKKTGSFTLVMLQVRNIYDISLKTRSNLKFDMLELRTLVLVKKTMC